MTGTKNSIYDGPELARTPANHVSLSPLSMLKRTARVHPEKPAVIHGATRRNWGETEQRCRRLASALARRGIGKGDTVAILAPNIPELMECHFAIPMLGAVLNANNTRLDAGTIAFILEHGEAVAFLVDSEYSTLAKAALEKTTMSPLIVDIEDEAAESGSRIGTLTYDELLAEGDPGFAYEPPKDEWDAITLNYTSGTTGEPKGVVYSHRGAYVNAVNNSITWAMPHFPVYLWTLPMFHCNGWCFPWTITMLAGTHVCLRKVNAETIFAAIAEHGVTHLCGAPIIMNMLVGAKPEARRSYTQKVEMMTAAAPPPASVIAGIEQLGIRVTHVYGLTEVYGPAVWCDWKPEWDDLPLEERARLKARQGVAYELQEDVIVLDPETKQPVAWDGETLGEIAMRGNIVMKGYLKAEPATAEAFADGWFWTGDLAVTHPDGYIEIRDRSKDIINTGGEKISSIEVEKILYLHPAVALAAVVAMPDDKWGETPCAFVELAPGASVTEAELIEHCGAHLAGFKRPKRVVFDELPKTVTGKIRKNELRERVRGGDLT
ncbi:MAG: acyl-CoA synthetase [Pseudomonadota bacterium]